MRTVFLLSSLMQWCNRSSTALLFVAAEEELFIPREDRIGSTASTTNTEVEEHVNPFDLRPSRSRYYSYVESSPSKASKAQNMAYDFGNNNIAYLYGGKSKSYTEVTTPLVSNYYYNGGGKSDKGGKAGKSMPAAVQYWVPPPLPPSPITTPSPPPETTTTTTTSTTSAATAATTTTQVATTTTPPASTASSTISAGTSSSTTAPEITTTTSEEAAATTTTMPDTATTSSENVSITTSIATTNETSTSSTASPETTTSNATTAIESSTQTSPSTTAAAEVSTTTAAEVITATVITTTLTASTVTELSTTVTTDVAESTTAATTPGGPLKISISYDISNQCGLDADKIMNEVNNTLKTGLIAATTEILNQALNEAGVRSSDTHALGGFLFFRGSVDEAPIRYYKLGEPNGRALAKYSEEYPVTIDQIIDVDDPCEEGNNCQLIMTSVYVELEEGDDPNEVNTAITDSILNSLDDGSFNDAIPTDTVVCPTGERSDLIITLAQYDGLF